jgi:excisionase family DNA binding protein
MSNYRKEWLSVTEFADALGVTKSAVRRWLLERRIASTRFGRLVRIPIAEIERLAKEGLRPARPARSVR